MLQIIETLYDTVQKGRQSEDSNVVEKLQGEDNQEINLIKLKHKENHQVENG